MRINKTSFITFICLSLAVFIICRAYAARSSDIPAQAKNIVIQPIGKFDKVLLAQTKLEVQKYFTKVIIMPQIEFYPSSYSNIRRRHIADTVIKNLSRLASGSEIYVGITQSDICTKKNGIPDFGIMGLGFKPGKACICSTKRLKNKSMFFKIVLHEIGHNYGLDHCPVDTCFMHAAEGRDRTSIVTGFCPKCKKYLKEKGWRI